ncbi:unnamed protein product [Mesocestoides corti]|uniref:THIF-type NAD/FAD binding fold domain-containing protein n=1 Tax=Mesocestoides corti TaxID=53468 RepID=A0A0R3UJ64_MESCO|nr:unnamed protein product [Mesocestoides corti]
MGNSRYFLVKVELEVPELIQTSCVLAGVRRLMCTPKALSEEEAALYDRQIRLWGLEAQSKLKRAKLLLLGLSPVAGEIIKNIVLCGISTLTIADRKTVTEDDIEHCFLYEESHFGQLFVQYPSIKELFDLTWRGEQASRLSAKRMPKGFFLARLISQVNGPITSQALQDAWYNVAEDLGVPTTLLSIEDFESCCGMSSVAINAIIGGIISQEVIQGLSHKGTPKGNWYFMDGRTCEVTVLWIPSRAQRPDSSS